LYRELTTELGEPVFERINVAATREQKAILSKLSPDQVIATKLAGDRIVAMLTTAPDNGGSIGGLKIVTAKAGSPPVRQAPKMCTNSTPRASKGKSVRRRLRPNSGH
jgi:phosphoglucomutase